MLRLKHKNLIFLAGLVWLAIGAMLFMKGLSLLPTIWTFLLPLALVIGSLKGHFVLKKAANRQIARIRSFPEPHSVLRLYSPQYGLLLLLMVGLGMAMRFSGLPLTVRGFIDVAIGMALILGAKPYFLQDLT